MYEQYYGIRTNPFTLTPDPEYLFLSNAHREAIAGLTYSVLMKKGITVLTGDAGTGKTTLIRTIMRAIPRTRAVFSVVLNPMLTAREFLRSCMVDFGVAVEGEDAKDRLLAQFQQFLLRTHQENRAAVLIVDEAHRLSPELLEEVRLLANFETDREKLLQIVLVGQDELGDILDRHDLRQLKQRVAVRLHIGPLTADAVSFYIQHRWARAHGERCPFAPDSVAAIASASHGIPRLINCLCDNALVLGFSRHAPTITADHISAVARDLHLDSYVYPAADAFAADKPERSAPGCIPTDSPAEPEPVPVEAAQDEIADTPKRGWRFRLGLTARETI